MKERRGLRVRGDEVGVEVEVSEIKVESGDEI